MPRKWYFIGERLPADQEECYCRFANNEYWPNEGVFDFATLSFKDPSGSVYIPIEKFIKWTSKFI